jgi:hypothetical protein
VPYQLLFLAHLIIGLFSEAVAEELAEVSKVSGSPRKSKRKCKRKCLQKMAEVSGSACKSTLSKQAI